MADDFHGRVALVTGAASGIGAACVRDFAGAGATVVAADLDRTGAAALADATRGDVSALGLDVRDPGEVEDAIRAVVADHGGLDCAVNSAGISNPTGPTGDISLEDWNATLAVNLTGTFLCVQAEIRAMLEAGGAIVNIASGAGLVGHPGDPAYVASKHGLVGLTKAAALEYARRGIRINAVCPGAVRTPMLDRYLAGDERREKQLLMGQPNGRLGAPEEIAAAALWLCSDAAGYVVGHAFPVDGGATVW